MLKTCTKCHVGQVLTDFYRDKKSRDGYGWACKLCVKAATHMWVLHNPEKVKAKSQAYQQKYPEKIKAKTKKYYDEHPEQCRQKSAAWRKTHPEHVKTSKANYRASNPEKIKAYRQKNRERDRVSSANYHAKDPERSRQRLAAWRLANPEKAQAHVERRRARLLAASPNDFTGSQWREIKAAYGHRCVYCGKKPQRLEMDHILSLAQGGAHTASNIVPACRNCNAKKGTGPAPSPVQPLLLTIERPKMP